MTSYKARRVGAKLLGAILVSLAVQTASPEQINAHRLQPWQDRILVEESIRADAWYWKLEHTVHCESDHYSMDVIEGRRLGRAGEIGAVQLHPKGLLRSFYGAGFTNPYNFRESVRFLAQMMASNPIRFLQQHWSCYPR